jgi:hypothetical protein
VLMSHEQGHYHFSLQKQLKLAALGCGYKIVEWVDEERIPVVEGLADHPIEWRPHLDDGDSRKLQLEMEIDITFGMGSEYFERVARIGCPSGGVPPKGQPAWEVPLGQSDTEEEIRTLVLLCAAYRMQRMLDPDSGSNIVLLRKQ